MQELEREVMALHRKEFDEKASLNKELTRVSARGYNGVKGKVQGGRGVCHACIQGPLCVCVNVHACLLRSSVIPYIVYLL